MLSLSSSEPHVRVVVVDDSRIARRLIVAVLSSDKRFRVVGEGASGPEAVALVKQLRPDLLTLDVEMPGGDGLAAIETIMATAPLPILVISGVSRAKGRDVAFEALASGAVDIATKDVVFGVGDGSATLLDRAVVAARVQVVPHVRGARVNRQTARPHTGGTPHVVVVGASTGGPRALAEILGTLDNTQLPPMVVVQHMVPEFAGRFVAWLRERTRLCVVEAAAGVRVQAGHVYVAADGPHIRLTPDGTVATCATSGGVHMPAIDALFSSASCFGPRALGVLLTGMGDDGARGLLQIHQRGGATVAESEESAAVWGMPGAAVGMGAVDRILERSAIAQLLASLTPRRGGI